MSMRILLLAVMLSPLPAAAQTQPVWDSLKQGCGFDGAACSAPVGPVKASGSPTDDLIRETIDDSSGLSGELLRKTREGEAQLLQRTIDESPTLKKAFEDADSNRTWNDYYQDRNMDAAVASWGSNMKAGYLKCTAAAYATYKTAPPVVAELGGAVLWVAGAVAGVGLGLLASAFTGHF